MTPRRVLTDEDRAAILRGIADGEGIIPLMRRLGVPPLLFYKLRRADPEFEAQVMDAAKASGRGEGAPRPIRPIRSTTPRFDAAKVRRIVLKALRLGATLGEAATAAGVTYMTVSQMRRDDPRFDREVVAAAALGRRSWTPQRRKGADPELLSPPGPLTEDP